MPLKEQTQAILRDSRCNILSITNETKNSEKRSRGKKMPFDKEMCLFRIFLNLTSNTVSSINFDRQFACPSPVAEIPQNKWKIRSEIHGIKSCDESEIFN